MEKGYYKVYLWRDISPKTVYSNLIALTDFKFADDSMVEVRTDITEDSVRRTFCPILAEADGENNSILTDIITGKQFDFSVKRKDGLHFYNRVPASKVQVADVLSQLEPTDIKRYRQAIVELEQMTEEDIVDKRLRQEKTADTIISDFKIKVKSIIPRSNE